MFFFLVFHVVAEEKTFGLKNKNKSKKVQQKIDQIKSAANHMDKEAMKKAAAKKAAAEEKRMAAILKAQNDALMAGSVVIKQKEVPPGVDPKSIVCEYFRANRCNKGNKCKFAHDLKVEMKAAKINMFEDVRDSAKESAPKEESMDEWDADKLAQVVDSKQDVVNRNLPTKIVCKHFLDAIENSKYGWFWECPNGGKKCMYRHALPEGYVLKRDRKRLEEEKEKGPTLEELIERERNRIGVGTPVNEATFAAWMRRKRRAAARKRLQDAAAREVAIKQGKEKMSGREAFMQNPNMHDGDAEADEGDEFDATELNNDDEPAEGAAEEAPDDTPMKVWETNEYQLREDDDAADAADLAILQAAKAEAKAKYDAMSAQKAKEKAEKGDNDDDDDDDDDDNDDNDDDADDADDDDEDDNADDDDDNDDDDNDDAADDNDAGEQQAAASSSTSAAAPAAAIDASVFAGQNLDELPDFSDDEA
jgi:hypothetical protein